MKQLSIFFVLAYALSWLMWLPLYGPAIGIDGLPVLPFHHGIGAFGPMLASVIVTGVFYGRAAVMQLLRRCVQIVPVVYIIIALISPFLLAFIASAMDHYINGAAIDMTALLSVKEFPEFTLLSFFCYNLIFFGFGEEIGWRGFALPKLQGRYNALTSGILLTFFWALWHLPLFLYRPGYVSMGIAGITGWVLSLLTGSVLLTWLYNSSRGSLLACAIFHSTIDIAFTADFADKNITGYMGMLITIWGIATIFIFRPKDLSHKERQQQTV